MLPFLFYLLAFLNLADGGFTFYGIANDFMEEANPFMNWLWSLHPFLFLTVKLLLSFLLLVIGRKASSQITYKKSFSFSLLLLNLLYLFVLALHLYWFIPILSRSPL